MTNTLSTLAVLLLLTACNANPGTPNGDATPPAERVSGRQDVIYFGFGESAITEEADEALRETAMQMREFGPTRIQLAGHADTAEPDPAAVSKARADLVARRLAALGVTAEIQVRGAGANELAIETPAGVREAQNRRVTIAY